MDDFKIDPTIEIKGSDLGAVVHACLDSGRISVEVYLEGLEGGTMKCTECSNTMTKSIGDHHYTECGLDNVILHGITLLECESCGAKRAVIPAMAQLHRAIARALARKPARLVPAEVAYLRDHLDLSNKEFAELMGVSPEHTSRWASSEPIGVPAERFLRMLAIIGPDAVAVRKKRPSIDEQFEIDVAELVGALGTLPPRDAPAREVPIGLRRAGSAGWKTSENRPS